MPKTYGESVAFAREAQALLRSLTNDSNAEFRADQLEAIETVVEDRSKALVVQRTGWGKSAVYLISTRLIRDGGGGPTVIVSPLLALMRNQLQMTERLDLKGETVNHTNRDDWPRIFEAINRKSVDLLLISPEMLNNWRFRRDLMSKLFSDIGLLVIDEVHCISDWGHDFRPDYRRLRQVVDSLPPNVPVLGTTATANDRVIEDIEEQLGADLVVFRGTLERESLALQVLNIEDKAERMAWLAEQIPDLPGSGIVYCLTVHDAERIGEWLRSHGIDAVAYTGPMDHEERLDIEKRLTDGELKVVSATSALGMGYDNPAIEFVIHYQTPGSAIAYYQQVGRAGRAVERSFGIAMSGWEDQDIQDWFINTAFPAEEDCLLVLDRLRDSEDGLSLKEIKELVNLRHRRLESMLKILEVEGAVYKEGARWRRSAERWDYPRHRIEAVTETRRAEQAAMREYVSTEACLMEFLRKQLDDPGAERCGRCANCVGALFSPDVDQALVEKALAYYRKSDLEIKPRKQMPCDVDLGFDLKTHRIETGRCLTRWGDPGLARLVEAGRFRDHHFDEQLVEACAELLSEWAPGPEPTWLAWIPSRSAGEVIEDFARRLAATLDIEPVNAIKRVQESEPQKSMENSCQQARNVAGSFALTEMRSGPVLLFDDVVDSGWTLSVVGGQLLSAGSGPVYPLALADTSGGGA